MRRTFLLLHNPRAGVRGTELVARVVSALKRRGASVRCEATAEAAQAQSLAAEAHGYDGLIAAGGDGTVRAILCALAGRTTVPIGVIPIGTGNVLAGEIGLPRNPEPLADVLMTGAVVEIQAGLVNGQPFALMVGVGFDGEVIRRLDQRWKRRFGKFAYAGPILASLAATPVTLDVIADGHAHVAEWVIATRARRYGGSFTIAPGASLRAPGLQAIVMPPAPMATRLWRLAALVAGRLEHQPGITVIRCSTLSVQASQRVPVEVDGDAFGSTPIEVNANGPVFALIVPGDYAGT